MAEEKIDSKAKKEDKNIKTLVVAQLPTQNLNRVQDKETGEEFNLLTIEEALTLLVEKVTKIEKATA